MANCDSDIEPITCWPPEPLNKQAMSGDVEGASNAGTQHGISSQTKLPNENENIDLKRQKYIAEEIEQRFECYADVALAKWWRIHGKNDLASEINPPKSNNPRTLLNFLTKTEKAKIFMNQEIKRIKKLLERKNMSSMARKNKLAALSTYFEKLKLFHDAWQLIEEAHDINGSDETEGSICSNETEDIREMKWLREKIYRQNKMKESQDVFQLRIADLPSLQIPEFLKVEKRSAKLLSVEEFYINYANKGIPVVITDLVEHMTSVPWNLEHISEQAGDCLATLKKLEPNSVEWARLEDSDTVKVLDFVKELNNNQQTSNNKRYLFDWSIPLHCPRLAEEITVPKYFTNDFLQRTAEGSLYKDSWPSLFIAPPGIRSELHVDAFGSNFWMALFEGRKRWVFFDKEEVPLLYPEYANSMDPVFEVDLADPDVDKYPLLAITHPKECILQPGEVLFVPAGSPHRVENLEQSIAISANFVDESNFNTVKQELKINSLIDDRANDLLSQLTKPNFNCDMDYDVNHMPWSEFKRRK